MTTRSNATAETERRWVVRGFYPDNRMLGFTVMAFDYRDAVGKAHQRNKSSATITDIVLSAE